MPNLLSVLTTAKEALEAAIEENSGIENILPTLFDNHNRRSLRAVMAATGLDECEITNFVCDSPNYQLVQGRQKVYVAQV